MSGIVTKSVDGKNYVIGEIILQSLPIEFSGELKHLRNLEELNSEVKKDFSRLGGFLYASRVL